MKSFTRMRGRVFWLLCALSVLLTGIAAGSSSSGTDFSGTRHAMGSASQAGPKTRLYAESHRNLTATGDRHVDSADADSESGDRVRTCALLAGLHISQGAPRLEDFGRAVAHVKGKYHDLPSVHLAYAAALARQAGRKCRCTSRYRITRSSASAGWSGIRY
jgi:hypothetical protein